MSNFSSLRFFESLLKRCWASVPNLMYWRLAPTALSCVRQTELPLQLERMAPEDRNRRLRGRQMQRDCGLPEKA